VVLICQAGGRSARALRSALDAGRMDVRHYPGGMSGWQARGGPVTKTKATTATKKSPRTCRSSNGVGVFGELPCCLVGIEACPSAHH
jgi:hypothetical protein